MIRWNFAPLGAMAKGEIPFDPKVAASNSARIEAMTHMILESFPQGSEQGAKTAAKPEIWQDWGMTSRAS